MREPSCLNSRLEMEAVLENLIYPETNEGPLLKDLTFLREGRNWERRKGGFLAHGNVPYRFMTAVAPATGQHRTVYGSSTSTSTVRLSDMGPAVGCRTAGGRHPVSSATVSGCFKQFHTFTHQISVVKPTLTGRCFPIYGKSNGQYSTTVCKKGRAPKT